MAKPAEPHSGSQQNNQNTATSSANPNEPPSESSGKPKKKRPRGGKNRRKTRRQSFAAPSESNPDIDERPSLLDAPRTSAQDSSFYRLKTGNRSNTSLESEALLDHRGHATGRSRHQSLSQGFTRPSLPFVRHRGSQAAAQAVTPGQKVPRFSRENPISEDEDEMAATDKTPLLGMSKKNRSRPDVSRTNSGANYGSHGSGRPRRLSKNSTTSSKRKLDTPGRSRQATVESDDEEYDVNNPPSVPGTPKIGNLDDVMIAELSNSQNDRGRDTVITIDDGYGEDDRRYSSASGDGMRRRLTVADLAERDVCFPGDAGLSEIGEEDDDRGSRRGSTRRHHRRRGNQWPDLEVLQEWSREEKEERTQQEHIRVKRISEPVMVGGRLRPGKTVWHREEDDAPFRFTYFNELLDGTIHARTISDLLQDGATFRDLFVPEPVELSDSSGDEGGEEVASSLQRQSLGHALNGRLGPAGQPHSKTSPGMSETASAITEKRSPSASKSNTGSNTPANADSASQMRPRAERASKRYGARPTWWLDVMQPTEEEMKVISRAFGIHQLTSEDIMVGEEREKVELFQYVSSQIRHAHHDRPFADKESSGTTTSLTTAPSNRTRIARITWSPLTCMSSSSATAFSPSTRV